MPAPSDEEFDEFANQLQAEVDAAVQATYSPNALDLIKHETNMIRMDDATGTGTAIDEDGESITIYLHVDPAGIVDRATFETTGCKPSIAAGAQATLLVRLKPVAVASTVTATTLMNAIGKLPPEYHKYVECAASALRRAAALATGREGT